VTAPGSFDAVRSRARWSDLGLTPYDRAMALMDRLRERVQAEGGGYVLFLEHPPTITLGYSLRGDEGRSALRSPAPVLQAAGIEVVEVDRGGKATYHGPGQLVCYPVLSLKELGLGVKRYVGKLMELVMEALTELGAAAELDPQYPGVWTGGAKIAAVGIRVAERVSTHGFAVNLDPDLAAFGHIVPCGIADRPVTSLHAIGLHPGRRELIDRLVGRMERKFKLELREAAPEQIWSRLTRGDA
jgi:lipoate-protein ligase B